MVQSHDESTAQALVTPGARLRGLLASGGLIMAPGVFDGLSAHLARRTGFRAAYLTGAGVAASGFGLPDIGLVTGSEMAERASLLTDVLGPLPLIADADTGYGAPLNVIRTVRRYEKAGVAAIQLEDQTFPKRCGHLYPSHLLMAAAEGMIAALQDLGGTAPEVTATGVTALFQLVGLREWSAIGDAWVTRTSRTESGH